MPHIHASINTYPSLHNSVNNTNNDQAVPEGIYGWLSNDSSRPGNSYRDNTYKAVRLLSDDYSLYYSVWCTGDVEFYDLKVIPSSSFQ